MKTKAKKTGNKVVKRASPINREPRKTYATDRDGNIHMFGAIARFRQVKDAEGLTMIGSGQYYRTKHSGVTLYDRTGEKTTVTTKLVEPAAQPEQVAKAAPSAPQPVQVVERSISLREYATVAFNGALQALEAMQADRQPLIVHVPQNAQPSAH